MPPFWRYVKHLTSAQRQPVEPNVPHQRKPIVVGSACIHLRGVVQYEVVVRVQPFRVFRSCEDDEFSAENLAHERKRHPRLITLQIFDGDRHGAHVRIINLPDTADCGTGRYEAARQCLLDRAMLLCVAVRPFGQCSREWQCPLEEQEFDQTNHAALGRPVVAFPPNRTARSRYFAQGSPETSLAFETNHHCCTENQSRLVRFVRRPLLADSLDRATVPLPASHRLFHSERPVALYRSIGF